MIFPPVQIKKNPSVEILITLRHESFVMTYPLEQNILDCYITLPDFPFGDPDSLLGQPSQ